MTDKHPTMGFLLHDVARFLRKRFEQKAGNLGLTRSQWQAIAFLAKNEGIHQAALAEMLEIEAITLVRILDKLVERGFVERRQHPSDRRVWQLFLRAEAHPILSEMQILGEETRAEALNGLNEAERDALFDMLTKIKCNLIAVSRKASADRDVNYG